MKERPIIFSPEMVRAILSGRKTQTRRVVKNVLPEIYKMDIGITGFVVGHDIEGCESWNGRCPYGRPGDLLWVRETRWLNGGYVATDKPNIKNEGKIPSIFMPKRSARIWLKMLNVRVERLQDISESGAQREGWFFQNHDLMKKYDPVTMDIARRWFQELWNKINGKKYPWESNPWVWVVEFGRVEQGTSGKLDG